MTDELLYLLIEDLKKDLDNSHKLRKLSAIFYYFHRRSLNIRLGIAR